MKRNYYLLMSIIALVLFTGVGANAYSDDSSFNKHENVFTYIDDLGNENKIYWASGIEAPKMGKKSELNDPKNPTKEGYFYDIKEKPQNDKYSHQRYEYPIELDKGYYDLNKNLDDRYEIEQPLCYLGASANLLLWWIDQNEEYINRYIEKIKLNEFEQIDVFKNTIPYENNKNTWDNLFQRPSFTIVSNAYQTELGNLPFVTDALKPYYYKGDGGYEDRVFDFFINGYKMENPNDNSAIVENSFDDFKPDSRGGYFNNIFGANRLSKRYNNIDYEFYNDNLKKFLLEGKGISLSYYPPQNTSTHAITLWGAEYDHNGNLSRIYVTDTDDYGNSIKGFDGKYYARGLHSMEVRQKDGILHLTDITDLDVPGAQIQNMTTLDLGQDIFEERLNGDKEAKNIDIISEPSDRVAAVGGNITLSIDARIVNKDNYDSLYYQWYSTDKYGNNKTEVPNGNKSSITIKTKKPGKYYYICEIKSTRGKVKTKYSRIIEVNVDPSVSLVDALPPQVDEVYPYVREVKQGDELKLVVNARSLDGGVLTYQWYRTYDNSISKGEPIKGATSREFIVPTNQPGNFFYYPVVTNTNLEATGNQSVSNTPRFSVKVNVNKTTLRDFKPLASLAITYDTNTLTPNNVKLRFGARIENKYLDTKNKEYGLIILKGSDFELQKMVSNLDLNGLNSLKEKGYALSLTPVAVEGTNYSQFSWVINNVEPINYQIPLISYIYEVDINTNEILVSKSNTQSVYSLKDEYIMKKDEFNLSFEIVEVLKKL